MQGNRINASLWSSHGHASETPRHSPEHARYMGTYTANQKKADYIGEYFYENDTLRFINSEEGRIVMNTPTEQDVLIAQYMLDGNANDNSGNGHTGTVFGGAGATNNRNGETGKALLLDGTDDYVSIPNDAVFNFGSNNFSVSFWVKKLANTSAWDNGVGVGKWNTGASPGTNSWSLSLGTGASDNIPTFVIESGNFLYTAGGTTAMQLNQWYYLQGVRQGNLLKLFVNGVLEGVATLPAATTAVNTTTLPVYVGRLPQGLYTNAVFDEIQIVHETTSNSSGQYEYQYNLKDHLGNVRLTFTTVNSTDQATATLEDANATTEQAKFLRYTTAKRVYSSIFDRTNGTNGSTTPGYAERLNGSTFEKFGVARSLSVMPGDTIRAEVYGKFVEPDNGPNWDATFRNLMGQISSNATGVVVDGANYSTSTSSFPFAGVLSTAGSTGGPKAYLNWLIYDRNFNFITGGYSRMSANPSEHGQDVAHEKLSSPDIIIAQPGYVYIYLSNEETSPVEVFFDDFKVTQIKSPVIETSDYYPFGLAFNQYQRENTLINKFKFQSQEHVDDLGLNWDSFKWRNHQPDIGRFFNVDPLSEKYYYNSPYAFSENKVVAHREIEGLESAPINAGSNPLYYMADGFGTYFQAMGSAVDKFSVSVSSTVSTVVHEAKVNLGFAEGTEKTTRDVTETTTAGTNLGEFFNKNNTVNNQVVVSPFKMDTKLEVSQNTKLETKTTVMGLDLKMSSSAKLNTGTGDVSKTSEASLGKAGNGVYGSVKSDSKGTTGNVGVQATGTTTDADGKTTRSINIRFNLQLFDDKKK